MGIFTVWKVYVSDLHLSENECSFHYSMPFDGSIVKIYLGTTHNRNNMVISQQEMRTLQKFLKECN